MARLIDVRNLHFHYPDGAAALRGVDFHLEEGESVALLGPNGSGKTTFILHLNGLLSGEGAVEVCGLPARKPNLAAIRRKVGMIFQDSESQLFMPSVIDDVAFGPLNLGMTAEEALSAARSALETVGMSAAAERAPYHLSAGEKKRVAIAGILAMNPEVLALDEPTTFLDPPGQRALAELLARLPQAKVIATHDAALARTLCSRAVFFQDGRIIAGGPVEEIVRRYSWDFAVEPAEPGRSPSS